MSDMTPASDRIDVEHAAALRIAGVSALVIALSYPVIIALFLVAGVDLPEGEGGQAWLDYLSGHETAWSAIVVLSVFTDVLWILVAWGLYLSLRTIDRVWALIGTGLMVLFVILELTASWPSYAALIELSHQLASSATEAERASIAAAAGYAAAVQSSDLLPVYAIFIPGVGELILGGVMWKGGPFGRVAASLAIAIGALGVVAVVGPYVWAALDQVIVLGSFLSAIWFAVVGVRLVRMGEWALA